MRHRITALAGAVVAGAVLSTSFGATPAVADVPGFSVRVTAPDTFTAARPAETVTAVVTSESRRCRKVRWVLVVRSEVDPGQLRVTRVEEDGEFDTSVSRDGDTTTIIDEALDPGTLCRGRTVTGRWQISFDGPDGGDARFEAQAFDERETLLSTTGVSSTVRGQRVASPSPEPSETQGDDEDEDAAGGAGDDTGNAAAPPIAPDPGDAETALVSQDTSLLGPGLVVGGICVFLGVLLLIRLRARSREVRVEEQALPTGFYGMPPRR
ncbi:hypothetical protein Aph02nite_03290 [Actinoplanes philippinensis]|uniref:Uncharacterized protein n=1 Tax=Actinoplanes philippinensis TaxID=35752 RepID=A0A1I2D9S8_9ACTN|nr:hypothetical protein [Actinoplanes philippinensis]GIE74379.1 hypothetical protein Aph02nite_03290 [Actinoplanes philippinensis]SFE77286.1 hypothetical protein SAMN05421541_103503 [Actinoplanes philippinensis]